MSEQPSERGLVQQQRDSAPESGVEGRSSPLTGGSAGDEGEGQSLTDYLKVLYDRRWPVLTVFLTIFVTVTIYTFSEIPIYEAKAQVLIEKESTNVVSFKEAFEQNQTTDDYYQTQYKILQSRSLARRTLDMLKLWNHPLFVGRAGQKDASFGVRDLVNTPISWVLGKVRTAPPTEPPGMEETAAQSRVIDSFLGSLLVSPVRNSRLVDIRYESQDPTLAATVANGIAKAYIEQNLEFKFLSTKDASDWLGERLAEQRKKVEASEAALQGYREQNDAISLEDRQNIVVQKLADLNAAVTKAKTERIQKETLYEQIRVIQNDPNVVDTFPAVLSNVFIQQQKSQIADLQRQQAQLSEKLGPNHPDMLKVANGIREAEHKLQAEVAKIVQSVKSEYQSASVQERTLMGALDQQKRDALALNRKGIDYGALQRDAVTNRQIFESLLQRTKETGISGELRTSNIRVVDAAERPRRPARPSKTLNELIGLVAGAGFAVGLAFFLEYLDNRIKSPDQVKAHLGLSYLGMVPALFGDAALNPLINNGVPAGFSEAIRAVRTNVLFSSAEEGGRSLVVTSTGPGEGKTMVASNLAIALAQAGLRVLLVDADMRRPRVHEAFTCQQQPGLSNVLVGNARASQAVHSSGIPGLWLLCAGLQPPNPAELLGSNRFKEFLTTLHKHFDWTIIDSPPVMAVTDSSLVAHQARGVLFVVGAQMTSRHAARRAVEQLEQAQAKFVGAILNRVDLQHRGYYYSEYYRREYTDYYKSAS